MEGNELSPVNGSEPFVSFDILCAGLEISVALGQIRSQQALDKVLGVRVKVCWKLCLASNDIFKEPARVVIVKWSESREKLRLFLLVSRKKIDAVGAAYFINENSV